MAGCEIRYKERAGFGAWRMHACVAFTAGAQTFPESFGILCLLGLEGSRSPERLNKLPKVTQLAAIGTRSHVCLMPGLYQGPHHLFFVVVVLYCGQNLLLGVTLLVGPNAYHRINV